MKYTEVEIIRIFFVAAGIMLFLWWPLSHWFYSDFYHTLLGFEKGTYPDPMVKMIGSCGLLPVFMIFWISENPIEKRQMILILSAFSFILSATYIFLIQSGTFPVREYINAAISLFFGVILLHIYFSIQKKIIV